MIRVFATILLFFQGGLSLAVDSEIIPLSEIPEKFSLPLSETDFDKKLIAQVEGAGWYNMHVGKENDAPPFSFTIGHFHKRNHPEIIVIGLPAQVSHELLNVAAVLVNGGKKSLIPYKKYTDFTETLSVAFVPVNVGNYGEYLGYANWYYGSLPKPYPVLQMVWPDKEGKLPWEKDYDKRYFKLQPVLGAMPNTAK